jgi:CheY-like chemotaxis protein
MALAPASGSIRITESAASTAAHMAGPKTVLVVDDEDSVRQLIAVMLELEGHRVLQADNGQEALRIAAEQDLDLITLDVMMPGLDGWGVAAALDEDTRTSAVPRVMVSGVPLAQLQAEPGAARASAVLAKPFDFAEFVDIVQGLLITPLPVPAPRDGEALAG